MVYYIRFIKVPEVIRVKYRLSSLEVVCSFDIRNDLAEVLFTRPITVVATLFDEKSKQRIASTESLWQGNEWTKEIRLPASRGAPETGVILRLSCKPMSLLQAEATLGLLSIASTQSAPFRLVDGTKADSFAQRLVYAPSGHPSAAPWERVGSSIYGHVWDAGVMLAGHLMHLNRASSSGQLAQSSLEDQSPLSLLFAQSERPSKPYRILELGAGVGIVSLAVAEALPHCVIVPTDTEDALPLLSRNVKEARTTLGLRSQIEDPLRLHWDEEKHRQELDAKHWNVVLISDCTYNASSVPDLVSTLGRAATSPSTLVVVALKRRHEDESVFYTKMEDARFRVIHHRIFKVPDTSRVQAGLDEEQIELYQYRLQERD